MWVVAPSRCHRCQPVFALSADNNTFLRCTCNGLGRSCGKCDPDGGFSDTLWSCLSRRTATPAPPSQHYRRCALLGLGYQAYCRHHCHHRHQHGGVNWQTVVHANRANAVWGRTGPADFNLVSCSECSVWHRKLHIIMSCLLLGRAAESGQSTIIMNN